VHRTAHQIGMRTTATMMFGVGENYENRSTTSSGSMIAGRDGRIHRIYPLELSAAATPRWAAATGTKPPRSNI
jgi:2-iminoacetate synthase ThiH